jgi:hypothetical protein
VSNIDQPAFEVDGQLPTRPTDTFAPETGARHAWSTITSIASTTHLNRMWYLRQ